MTGKRTSDRLNFEKKLGDLQRNPYNVTPGKQMPLSRSLLSKLIYMYNVLVLSVPEAFSKQLDRFTFRILSQIINLIKFKKKLECTLIGVTKEGGLYMIEFESMNNALKASWVKRLNNDTDSPWEIIPNCTTQQYEGLNFFWLVRIITVRKNLR